MENWLDSVVGQLQGGNSPFAPPASPFPSPQDAGIYSPQDEAAMAQAAREAAAARLARGQIRPKVPDVTPFSDLMAPGVTMALGNGPQPLGGGAPFGPGITIPPSLQLAKADSAPPPPPPAQTVAPPPIPRSRPVAADDESDTDVSSQSRTPAPVVARPAPMGLVAPIARNPEETGTSFGDTLRNFGTTLMGVGGALGGDNGQMTAKILADREAKRVQNQQQNMTIQGLRAKGVPEADIAAAVGSPEILKALVGQYYGAGKYKVAKTGQDEFGGETYSLVNETDPTDVRPIVNGRVLDRAKGDAGVTGDEPAKSSASAYLAPGVSQVDKSLSGNDYLGQYSPDVQAAVRDYVAGKSMPTGNPRKGWTQNIKAIAQKYGQDIGVPADDTTFSARRTMRNDLAKTSPGSIGGQISIGNTALGHLADLSQKAVELGNWDVGLAGPSHAINAVRGMTSSQSAKMEALRGAAQHYGQEVTKFYSGSPGGEAERNRFLETVNAAKTPQELAAVLETEAALMRDRISAMESNIRATLGEEGVRQYPVIRDVGKKALDQLTSNVSALRGGGMPSSGTVKPGRYIWTPDRGLVPQ